MQDNFTHVMWISSTIMMNYLQMVSSEDSGLVRKLLQ